MFGKELPYQLARIDVSTCLSDSLFRVVLPAAGPGVTAAFDDVEHYLRAFAPLPVAFAFDLRPIG